MALKSTSAAPKGPSYYDLIKVAITELKDRTGSSRQAISKVVSSKKSIYDQKALNRALKAGIESGKLVPVKGSYKLSVAEKKPVKKTAAKKPAAKKTTKKAPSKKKTVVKKAPAKKTVTTKKKAPLKKKAPTKKPAAKKKATTTKSKAKTTSKKK